MRGTRSYTGVRSPEPKETGTGKTDEGGGTGRDETIESWGSTYDRTRQRKGGKTTSKRVRENRRPMSGSRPGRKKKCKLWLNTNGDTDRGETGEKVVLRGGSKFCSSVRTRQDRRFIDPLKKKREGVKRRYPRKKVDFLKTKLGYHREKTGHL